ncbi:unnamed protein product [Acanthoscelides obtectus]|uniref:Secreted protein n=1 Tax=Acanthoscelides obtectus TaxID=200917 RepID=A0A9P0PHJ9_ACAOB|nr:unnamed protein product [Acanthoscelides obtectus]CAK1619878.1 hypothetical protein AOBTE_LOCUS52 [Acanthoscelides obtectus]
MSGLMVVPAIFYIVVSYVHTCDIGISSFQNSTSGEKNGRYYQETSARTWHGTDISVAFSQLFCSKWKINISYSVQTVKNM